MEAQKERILVVDDEASIRRILETRRPALEAVTAADIQKAAQTYFTRSRLSVAHVLPEETSREGAQP